MVFPLLRQSAGVMEWWSNDKTNSSRNSDFRFCQYSSTPVLQNSSQSLPTKPLNSELALKTRFFMVNKSTWIFQNSKHFPYLRRGISAATAAMRFFVAGFILSLPKDSE
jgi:hypothetical protein